MKREGSPTQKKKKEQKKKSRRVYNTYRAVNKLKLEQMETETNHHVY